MFCRFCSELLCQHILVNIESDPSDLIGPGRLFEPDALRVEDLVVVAGDLLRDLIGRDAVITDRFLKLRSASEP